MSLFRHGRINAVCNPPGALLCIFLLLTVTRVYATVPNISGTYSGTLSGTQDQCGPFPGGPFSGGPNPLETETLIISITLIDPNTGTFAGSGTASSGAIISIGGQIDPAGNVISGAFSAQGTDTITSGSLSGSSFSGGKFFFVSNNAADTPVNPSSNTDVCLDVDVSSTLSKTSGSGIVIDPANTNSATLTNTQTLSIQVQGITASVGGRVSNVLRSNAIGTRINRTGFTVEGQANGINAGDEIPVGLGAWTSFTRTEFENDLVSLAFEGDRNTFLFGVDYSPWDNLVIGAAAGYEYSDIDTKINRGNIESDGFSFIPYFGYLLNDTFSISGSAGYTSVDADQYRRSVTGAVITSSPDSDRYFGSLNLDGIWLRGDWIFGGRIGMLWARNNQNRFFESNGVRVSKQETKLGQWQVGGNVAYSYDNFEPFVSMTYSRDYSFTEVTVISGPQPSNDRDDIMFGAGVRYYGDNGLTGNLEYNKRLDRDNLTEDSVSLTLRLDF